MDNLVKVENIKTDLAAYTGENILKRKFYETNACFVHQDLIEPLNKIQTELFEMGYQLVITDAYRPLSVQKLIFELIGGDTKYVSDPNNSRHPRGTAVDVSLLDLEGNKLEMPTSFSEFGQKCWADAECNTEALNNRTLLQNIMTNHGFEIYKYEWWHFDFKGWSDNDKYPALDFKI